MSPFHVTDARGFYVSLPIAHCLWHYILSVKINVPVVDSVRLEKSYCIIYQNPENYKLTLIIIDDMSRFSSPGKINVHYRPRASCLFYIGRRFLISSLQWSDIKQAWNSRDEVDIYFDECRKSLRKISTVCSKVAFRKYSTMWKPGSWFALTNNWLVSIWYKLLLTGISEQAKIVLQFF